jgi:hydroxymethylpyrimidine pyrophosphatase-like HAD family hydrolase
VRYFAVATDYDGTLAENGAVHPETVRALERCVASGRRLVLVTGRLRADLERVFPHLDLFERVVTENGAVIWTPSTREERALEAPPPASFVEALRARGVTPLSVGRIIVATWQPQEKAVLETIRDAGLELHVEFNKGAVMILPPGITKRSGLSAALDDMELSLHNAVGIGDAENDHSFLAACECGVAVANALPSLARAADWVTPAPRGAGVAQLIDRLLADDLESLGSSLRRHRLYVGRERGGGPVDVAPYAENILVTGPSGTGKTAIATALVERLVQHGYQLCVIDPEGDHGEHETLAVVGSSGHAPTVDEVSKLLAHPYRSVAANLLAIPMEERPSWFSAMLARVQDSRALRGRPHWLVVDEAHHVMPAARDDSTLALPKHLSESMLVTVHPERVSAAALGAVGLVLTTAEDARDTLQVLARTIARGLPPLPEAPDASLLWTLRQDRVVAVDVEPARRKHLRHKRKYARGELGEDKSFFFRGPQGALRLRAQNLGIFVQLAEGIDEATWTHHLIAGDYSRWLRQAIKDDDLADDAARIEEEGRRGLGAAESRKRIREAIEKRYSVQV